MDPIHDILQAIDQEEGKCVLATIVHVEGSAYRKEGTTMLIREDGRRVGVLTPGCLENDLASHAEDLFGGGAPQLLVYDMRTEDEEAWGQGAGCNGVIRILLETVDANMRKHLGALKKYLDSRIAVTVVKVVEGPFAGDYMYVAEGEEGERLFGEWRGGAREPLLRIARECGESGIRAAAGWYAHRFRPKPRLFLFGAGPDARPLCALAARTGFFVAVSDWRPAYCAREHFPEADVFMARVSA
jgi:xanthine dehydrogenase accessory factor